MENKTNTVKKKKTSTSHTKTPKKVEIKKEPEKIKEEKPVVINKPKKDYCNAIVAIFILSVLLGVVVFIGFKRVYSSITSSKNLNDVVNEVKINSSTELVLVEKGEKLKLIFDEDDITNITYTIEDRNIANIENNYVEGINEGVTSVKVTDNNEFEYVFNIKVISFDKSNAITAPTGIGLSKATLSLSVDQKSQITAVVFPEAASQSVTWSSSNTNIAKVDSKGNVTGVSKGTTQIYAETNNGISISCDVTVK